MHTRKHHKKKSDKKVQRQISPKQMILRCYAEKKDGVWQAFCLDLNLAVQGQSSQEVKRKMHEQIEMFLYDALEGEDRQYADQLLARKAPIGFWLKYYLYKTLNNATYAHNGIREFFNEVMPLRLSHA